jgi:hypothetical protein
MPNDCSCNGNCHVDRRRFGLGGGRLVVQLLGATAHSGGIGASILFYTIYSIIILREPFSFRYAFGMTANFGGLIALALSK